MTGVELRIVVRCMECYKYRSMSLRVVGGCCGVVLVVVGWGGAGGGLVGGGGGGGGGYIAIRG